MAVTVSRSVPFRPDVLGDIADDVGQRAYAQRVMSRNRQVMFGARERRDEPQMTARLAERLVRVVAAEQRGEFVPGEVPRQSQAGITSSWTR